MTNTMLLRRRESEGKKVHVYLGANYTRLSLFRARTDNIQRHSLSIRYLLRTLVALSIRYLLRTLVALTIRYLLRTLVALSIRYLLRTLVANLIQTF